MMTDEIKVPNLADTLITLQSAITAHELAADTLRKGDSVPRMATFFVHVRDQTRELEAVIKQFKSLQTQMAQVMVPEMFEEQGIKSFTLDSGHRVTTSVGMRASIKAGMKDDAYQWLRDHNLQDLILETVNASSLAATAREMQEEGEELDEDLFNVQIYNNTSVTKT